MDITAARANAGLSASAAATSTGVSGAVEIGTFNNAITLTGCNVAYSVRARLVAGSVFVIDTVDNDTSTSDGWSAGTAQVETATVTAASGITGSGNATVTVTAAGMTGSPKAISVALTTATHTTATLIATAIAAALNADTDYAALFTATSSTNTVITTRNASALGFLPANDATLNIALANGTCTGITAAPTSANTVAGVASSGVNISDGDGKDFEGVTIPAIATLKGLSIKCATGEVDLTSAGETATLTAGETRVFSNNAGIPSLRYVLTFTPFSDSDLTVTVIGATA